MTLRISKCITFVFIAVFMKAARAYDAAERSVIDVGAGTSLSLGQLQKIHPIVILTRVECLPCAKYMQELRNCPIEIRKKIALVSIDSPGKSRVHLKHMPKEAVFYVAERPEKWREVVTPTTYSATNAFVGFQPCQKLKAL